MSTRTNKPELPTHSESMFEVVSSFNDYVGQGVSDMKIDEQMARLYNFDEMAPLGSPVYYIRMAYPFTVTPPARYNVYKIPRVELWGELVKAIKKVCIREYKAGHNAACHRLSDYIIEAVAVHPNGFATVMIGS